MACNEKTRTDSGKVEIKEVALYDGEDDVPPPPPDLTSNFKTLQEWLRYICDDKKPTKPVVHYEFGLFESPEVNTLVLIGINKYNKGDTSYTRIEFEPSHKYFPLPKHEYNGLDREALINRLTSELRDFTGTKEFQSSFLIEADKITFAPNGQIIWSRPQ